MIFFAVAVPIPGTFSSSASVAEFRSTGALGATFSDAFFFVAGAFAVVGSTAAPGSCEAKFSEQAAKSVKRYLYGVFISFLWTKHTTDGKAAFR